MTTESTTIVIRGGFSGGRENDFAKSGELHWSRQDGESVAEFHSRAERESRAAGHKFLVFGGFPYPNYLKKGFKNG